MIIAWVISGEVFCHYKGILSKWPMRQLETHLEFGACFRSETAVVAKVFQMLAITWSMVMAKS